MKQQWYKIEDVQYSKKAMTDWKDIHPDFTDELQVEWEKQLGFDFWQVEELIKTGLEPKDSKLVFFILSIGYEVEDINEGGSMFLNELKEKFNKNEEISDYSSSSFEEESEEEIETRIAKKRKINSPERDWTNINSNFTPELIQEWKNYGFTYEECFDWININPLERHDLDIEEPAYYAWLRDVKKVDSEWVLNEGDPEELRNEYQEYLLANQQVQNTLFN